MFYFIFHVSGLILLVFYENDLSQAYEEGNLVPVDENHLWIFEIGISFVYFLLADIDSLLIFNHGEKPRGGTKGWNYGTT